MPHLGQELTDEVATIPKTRILRLKSRSGLIRAKVEGGKVAQGDVLTFLDSHCECNVGWLEPLLARIGESRSNVVTPVIDNIDKVSEETGPPAGRGVGGKARRPLRAHNFNGAAPWRDGRCSYPALYPAQKTFEYTGGPVVQTRGIFTWSLTFSWLE